MTPLSVTGSANVSGTVAATQSGTWNVSQGSSWVVTGGVAATQSGSWTVGITGTTAVSGTVAATQSGAWAVGLSTSIPAGANLIGSVSQSGTWNVGGTVAATQSGAWTVAQSGTWNITNISGTVSLPTGAATSAKQPGFGTAGTPSANVVSIQGVAGGTTIPVTATLAAGQTVAVTQATGTSLHAVIDSGSVTATLAPATSGGLSTYQSISVAGTNAVLVKAGAGQFFGFAGGNFNVLAAMRYLKIYDKATTPVPGTDTPILTFPLRAGADLNPILLLLGVQFNNGLGIAVTGGLALLDLTNILAGDTVVNILYK